MKFEKMETIIEELRKEKSELYTFVGERFRETAIRLNIPAPKGGFPIVDLKIMFFLRQKGFVKSCMMMQTEYDIDYNRIEILVPETVAKSMRLIK